MSKFNKALSLIMFMFCIFLLTACDYEYYLYHDAIRKDTEVDRIELINYNSPDAQENPLEIYQFDLERLEILEILNIDKIDSFLADIEEIGGLSGKLKQVLKSPNGVGIRLTYQDNGFTIITVTNINGIDAIFSGHYDADTNIEGTFGISWSKMIDDFKVLINGYFDTQIS